MNRPNICVSIDYALSAAHRLKNKEFSPVFILYFIYDISLCARACTVRSAVTGLCEWIRPNRLCDLQNFISIINIP